MSLQCFAVSMSCCDVPCCISANTNTHHFSMYSCTAVPNSHALLANVKERTVWISRVVFSIILTMLCFPELSLIQSLPPIWATKQPLNMQARYNNAGLNRYTSPGAGAITPWFNRSSVAMRDIEAGLELFIDYGQGEWIATALALIQLRFCNIHGRAHSLVLIAFRHI